MFDAAIRSRLEAPLDRIGEWLDRSGVAAGAMTAVGLVIGVGACVAIASDRWWLGLVLWVLNRIADGLDGPIARHSGASDQGGFFDIMADFAIYGGVLIAIGVARPETRLACLTVLFTYYLSGSAFLAFSSLATKRSLAGDGRSLNFPAGLAEGAETIVAYIVILALPSRSTTLLWVWAAIVGFTFLQRIVAVAALLRD